MQPAIYNFNPHVKGDTFKELSFIISDINGPLDLTGAAVYFYLRISPKHPTVYELSTVGNHVSISNTVPGKISIKEQIIDFPDATYRYKMKIVLANGKVFTYMAGSWPHILE